MAPVSALGGPLPSSLPEPGQVATHRAGSDPVLGGRRAVADDDREGRPPAAEEDRDERTANRGGDRADRRRRPAPDGGPLGPVPGLLAGAGPHPQRAPGQPAVAARARPAPAPGRGGGPH